MVDVVDGHHVILTNPEVMNILAWNWPEMGTHPRGKEFIMFCLRYRYFLTLRPCHSYILTALSSSHRYISNVCRSIAIFHICVMHPWYHLPSRWLSVLLVPLQKHSCSSCCHVFHTVFAGFVWIGNVNWLVWGRFWPLNAHAHIDQPLLVLMSATVVAPKKVEAASLCMNQFSLSNARYLCQHLHNEGILLPLWKKPLIKVKS